jgi:hypothetical protein
LEWLPSTSVARTICFYIAVFMLISMFIHIFSEKDSDGEFINYEMSFRDFAERMIFACIGLFLFFLPIVYFYGKLRDWLVNL